MREEDFETNTYDELSELLRRCSEVPEMYNEIMRLLWKRGLKGAELCLLVTDIVREYLQQPGRYKP